MWDLLGHPIDNINGLIIKESLDITEPWINELWIEEHIYKLSGSFLFFCIKNQSLYLDSNGTLGAIYSSDDHIVAATESLLNFVMRRTLSPNEKLRVQFDVMRDGWFAGGLTAYEGIERLLANHRLRLSSFTMERHWPAGQIVTRSTDEALSEIVTDTTATCHVLANSEKAIFSLTGGNETRFLLSCLKENKKSAQFMTISAPSSDLDLYLAKQLAEKFNLQYQQSKYVLATADQQEQWLSRAGYSMAGENLRMHPSVWAFKGHILVTGLGGEIGRGFLWGSIGDTFEVTAQFITDRLKFARHPLLINRINSWLENLPDGLDPYLTIDLAYIEHRMCCWGYAQSYCNPDPINISPMISRRSYSAMLSLPVEVRRRGNFITLAIERGWPELLSIPINEYGDSRDLIRKAKRGLMRPDRVFRKLRQYARL